MINLANYVFDVINGLPIIGNQSLNEIASKTGLSCKQAQTIYEYILYHTILIRNLQKENGYILHRGTMIHKLSPLPCSLLIGGAPERITFVLRILLKYGQKHVIDIGSSKKVYKAAEFSIDENYEVSWIRYVADAVFKENLHLAKPELNILKALTYNQKVKPRIVPAEKIVEYTKGSFLCRHERIRMIMPLCEAQISELEGIMDKQNLTTREKFFKRVQIAKEIAETMHFIHEQGYIHCDVKPENLLLLEGHPYFIDFGLASSIENPKIQYKGSLPYVAPETLKEGETSILSDIWTLGVVFYYLFIHAPKKKDSEEFTPGFIKKTNSLFEILDSIKNLKDEKQVEMDLRFLWNSACDEERLILDLLRNMLKVDKSQRFLLPKIIETLDQIELKMH